MSLGTWHGTPGRICGLDPREHAQQRPAGLPHVLQAGLPHELQAGLSQQRPAGLPHVLQAGLPHELQAAWVSRGRRTHGTSGDPAELQRRNFIEITSGDFLAAGQTHRNKQKTFKKPTKQNEVKGRRLLFRSGLLSRCTQRGGTRNTKMKIKLKITVFNVDKAGQDKAGQTHRNTCE